MSEFVLFAGGVGYFDLVNYSTVLNMYHTQIISTGSGENLERNNLTNEMIYMRI